MKNTCSLFILIFLVFSLVFLPVRSACAEKIRKAVYAGSFYPATRLKLTAFIDRLTRQVKPAQAQLPAQTTLKALILPHAGFIYSGLTAAHASQVLNENQFEKVILLGPDHRIGFKGGAISDVAAYLNPLGLIRLHEDASRLRMQSSLFQAIPASDRLEHSLEVVLPFLQYYIKKFELIPIVLGPDHIENYAEALDPMLDQNTLLVVSSDLSHYLRYSEAVDRDRETIQMILGLDADKLLKRNNAACGKIPILIAINMARKHDWHPVLLHYSNSGDTAGDHSKVVGYAAIAFYGGSSMQDNTVLPLNLSKNQGQALVRLARRTIMERLGQKATGDEPDNLTDSSFQEMRGTFVTLTIKDQLRGCIGSLDTTETILEGVRRNAINAAFNDPRFSPLEAGELDQVDIEVSILTEPQPLEYRDGEDLISKLRVNVDGVILRKGSASATFLPQVWEQLPQPEKFLSHLCEKARLPGDAWENEKEKLEVLTYQVQYFEEEK
jgi:AmmeMemoRadiSam system protein B/AmmeMemoRadiSam system protein A